MLALVLAFAGTTMSHAQAPADLPAGMTQEQFDALVDAISKSVAERLKAEGIPSAAAPAKSGKAAPAASPKPAPPKVAAADRPDEFAIFLHQAGRVIVALPEVGRRLASLPGLLDARPRGGNGPFAFLALLGLIAAVAVTAEAMVRRILTRFRDRLAAGSAPEQGLRSLVNLGLLVLLDGLGLCVVWLICRGAAGAWFAGTDGQDKLAVAVLTGIFAWRLYVLAFRVVLRPGLAPARLCAVSDEEARATLRPHRGDPAADHPVAHPVPGPGRPRDAARRPLGLSGAGRHRLSRGLHLARVPLAGGRPPMVRGTGHGVALGRPGRAPLDRRLPAVLHRPRRNADLRRHLGAAERVGGHAAHADPRGRPAVLRDPSPGLRPPPRFAAARADAGGRRAEIAGCRRALRPRRRADRRGAHRHADLGRRRARPGQRGRMGSAHPFVAHRGHHAVRGLRAVGGVQVRHRAVHGAQDRRRACRGPGTAMAPPRVPRVCRPSCRCCAPRWRWCWAWWRR